MGDGWVEGRGGSLIRSESKGRYQDSWEDRRPDAPVLTSTKMMLTLARWWLNIADPIADDRFPLRIPLEVFPVTSKAGDLNLKISHFKKQPLNLLLSAFLLSPNTKAKASGSKKRRRNSFGPLPPSSYLIRSDKSLAEALASETCYTDLLQTITQAFLCSSGLGFMRSL